ncbi:MAG: GntR family transcriptional regulator [Cyanobacteriota bacterium]|nr:GntR family transcriptional regulator [Cyanobacteriota bacterium]
MSKIEYCSLPLKWSPHPMPLPPLSDCPESSLAERVYTSLKEAILSLQVRPRDYLIIGDVAKEYSISRTPVREALILLEQEGWVENEGRRGARVTVPSVQKVMEVIEMQAVLEGYVARRATLICSEADLQAWANILDQAERAWREGSPHLSSDLGDQFHEALANKVGNQRIASQIVQLREHMDRVRPLIWKVAKAPLEESARQHRQIWQAIADGDPLKAEQLMMAHTLWFESELAAALEHV